MNKLTLHELKDIARSLDFQLDIVEQGKYLQIVASNVSEKDFLLEKLRELIQKIEDTQ